MLKFLGWIVLIAVVAIGGWYFFSASWRSGNGDNAAITFQGPEKIYLGLPFELLVGMQNNSGVVWREVKLSTFFNKNLKTKTLGNLGEGGLTSIPLELVATTASEAAVEVVLSYLPEGVDSRFEKRATWSLPETEAAVELTVAASEKIVSGQELELKIAYKNISPSDLEDLFLKIEHPKGYQLTKASQEASGGDNLWDLGGLHPGSEGKLSIFGNLATSEKEAEFKISLLREIERSKEVISEEKVKLVIEESPLAVGIVLNEVEDYLAKPGDNLFYAIGFTKKPSAASERSQIATIRAKLTGSMFDLSALTISDGGQIRAGSNEIIWRKASSSAGEEGDAVSFSLKVKNEYSIRRLSDRNLTLKVEAEVEVGKISSKTELETKLVGQAKVEAKGLFYDADSGILNRPGQYTIHWLITNYATDIKNVVIKAPLPLGVIFTGAAKSNIEAKPIFDAASQSMLWQIPRISAASGVVGRPVEGILQVQVSGVGSLLGETQLTAVDDFTGTTLTATAPEIKTSDIPPQ